jgi:hypothetical protein
MVAISVPPAPVGEKVTVKLPVEPADTEVGMLPRAKSAASVPVKVIPEIFKTRLPVFSIVKVTGDPEEETATFGKVVLPPSAMEVTPCRIFISGAVPVAEIFT